MRYLLAALLLIITTGQVNAENRLTELQSFFTTKSQRQQLDEKRNSGAYSDNSNQASSFQVKPLTVEMQGIVIRDNQKPVIFVNNENTLKTHHLSNDITVRDKRVKKQTYSVPLKVKGESLKLRPGEQWQETDRQVKDGYQIKASNEKPDGVDISPKIEIIN